MQDEVIEIMFNNVPGWRAVELDDGVGLAKASALRELPYKLDPKRAPYAKSIRWEEGMVTAVITPTRDVISKNWIRYQIEPIIILVAPSSNIDPDEVSFVKSNYKNIAYINDDNTGVHTGDIYYLARYEEDVVAHSLIVIFPDRDIQVSFGFSANDSVEEDKIISTVIEPLTQIASNFRDSPILDLLGAASRASKSSADLAFEYSVSGSFIPEGATVIYPTKGLDDGWKLYAHTGNDAIYSMMMLKSSLETPSSIVEDSISKIFEIPADSSGYPALGWRDGGIQLFLVPPKDIELEGVTPLIITISISNDRVSRKPNNNFDVLHTEDILGGVEVLAFGSSESALSEELSRYDHSYVGMLNNSNCTINLFYISDSEEHNSLYDDAVVMLCRNIAEYVYRITQSNMPED